MQQEGHAMLPLTLTRRFPKGNAFIWSGLAFNTAFGPATLACQLPQLRLGLRENPSGSVFGEPAKETTLTSKPRKQGAGQPSQAGPLTPFVVA